MFFFLNYQRSLFQNLYLIPFSDKYTSDKCHSRSQTPPKQCLIFFILFSIKLFQLLIKMLKSFCNCTTFQNKGNGNTSVMVSGQPIRNVLVFCSFITASNQRKQFCCLLSVSYPISFRSVPNEVSRVIISIRTIEQNSVQQIQHCRSLQAFICVFFCCIK